MRKTDVDFNILSIISKNTPWNLTPTGFENLNIAAVFRRKPESVITS